MRSIVLASALTLAAAAAQTPAPPLNELLRDGLYAEEVSRDTEAAARSYDQILTRASADEPFISNALFRMAEIRRKQERKDEAIALYQRLLTRYPDADPQAKLSREALAKLGVTTTSPSPGKEDDESREVQRLEKLLQSSPDLLSKGDFFLENVQKGWERPIMFLLDHGAAANSETVGLGLIRAATIGHLGIVKTLLGRGVDPKGDSSQRALCFAASAGNTSVVKALLEFGVTPIPGQDEDFMSQYPALNLAASQGYLEIARLLLDHGAPVDQVPLFQARTKRPDNFVISQGSAIFGAISRGHSEVVDLLIEHHANVNLGNSYSEATPLALAADLQGKEGTEMMAKLLAAGADPKIPAPGDRSLLQRAALSDNVESLKLLLDHGATVEPEWIAKGFTPSGSKTQLELLQRLVFPIWSQEPRVRIIANPGRYLNNGYPAKSDSDNDFVTTTPVLADRERGDWIGCPATLLLDLKSLSTTASSSTLTIHRRNSAGGWLSIPFDFGNSAPYPELQWGDILMVGYKQNPTSRSGPTRSGWSEEATTSLRQHVVVPITVEMDGREQALTLHGDCLIYNPTKSVAPWMDAWYLHEALYGNALGAPSSVAIHRQGAAEPIAVTWETRPMFHAGDRLVIRQSDLDNTRRRKDEIHVISPGLWFDIRLGEDPSIAREEAENRFLPPTLFQAIAECYVGIRWPDNLSYPRDFLNLSWQPNRPWFVLPHPDLSRVRIRRQSSDGTETIIDVNIDDAAARCIPETTAEEARLLDQPLLPGDIVELKPILGKADAPWTGFDEAQSRLFSKALSGQITLASPGQTITKDISYAPATFLQSAYGPVPVERASNSTTTIRADRLFASWGYPGSNTITLVRSGKTGEASTPAVLLRDGDRIEMKSAPVPQGVRPPRPRILPSTSGG